MTPEALRNVLEAAMLASGRALSLDDFLALFEGSPEAPDRETLRAALDSLGESMADRSLELVQVASGFRLQVRKEYSAWLGGLFSERPPRYSRALLETLALIAYRQPVTRGEIEEVRGVAVSSNIIKTLMEREWIRVLGHREVPGRPALYGTTREFLDHFGLRGLDGLPGLAEIRDLDRLEPDLFAALPPGAQDADSAQDAAPALAARDDDGADEVHDDEGADEVHDDEGADEVHDDAGADEVRDDAGADEVRDDAGADEVRDDAGADGLRDDEAAAGAVQPSDDDDGGTTRGA